MDNPQANCHTEAGESLPSLDFPTGGDGPIMLSHENTEKRGKYRQIVTFIEDAITAGTYAEGARLPSESELVKQFGTSRPTVSRAMRELQSSGLIQRRAGSGSFVSKAAATDEQHRLFGVLIPRLGDTEIFESICGQIVREAEIGRHGLFWADLSSSGTGQQMADRTCEPYIRQGVSGVFFAPLEWSPEKDELNRKIIAKFEEAGIHIVLLDRDYTPFPTRSKYDLVGVDNYAAGYLLGKHMAESGCKRVAFFARPFSAATVQSRIAGAYGALMATGRAPAENWVQIADASDATQVKAMLDTVRPDGIICANDKTAAELMHSLEKLRVHVPKDVKIGGVDDVHYAKLLRPGLTTVHQPCHAIGKVAMQIMLDRVANPKGPARQVLLPLTLVVRQSSSTSND